ncbi:hypothetical protein [Hyalangium versicolor]|uniref:hypothetical protein n=1 Tax=Hyalangium versicolor TaxID=2861190 RepID=UPI001CC9BC40|nr:hypothetical protein [Hyalangium versicolor]
MGLTALCGAIWGCGPTELPEEEAGLSQSSQSLTDFNGLATNGLATNGLATNGLATNGLATNGLATNGLFSVWLNQDPEVRVDLMKYIIACAVPAGEVRTYTNKKTGKRYQWEGQMGLTPSWAAGHPATEVEEQLVSACLAAHANPYGLHVNFSLQGRTAVGTEIPFTSQELSQYSVRESCFFGNLFRNQGLYAGNDRNSLDPDESTVRGCGLSRTMIGENPECEPIYRVGRCDLFTCTLDATGRYYTQCFLFGKAYRPLTTRVLPSAINVCGDGVCQVTEHCGKGWGGRGRTPDNCGVDCGRCD